jgi:SAM-dependent methyltransferase
MKTATKPEYGNWVSKRIVYGAFIFGVAFIVVGLFYQILWVVAAVSFLVAAYFTYARFLFGPGGGDMQGKILELVLGRLDWDGKGRALDIGCGNGPLTIRLARSRPGSRVVGIDYWGGGWGYSKEMCQRNAETEGVADRVSFQKASASSLPFEDGYFDAAVSNLTFHEVKDVADKRKAIREGLRVLRKGGKFAFQDLFLLRGAFGDTDELVKVLRGWGVTKVEFISTRDSPFIPRLLKLPFMLGTMGILFGEK